MRIIWPPPSSGSADSGTAGSEGRSERISVANSGAVNGLERPFEEKTMAREPKYGVTLNGWDRLLAALEANAAEFPQFDSYREALKAKIAAAQEASSQQTALAASKQETTKRLQGALVEGRKLANFLRNGVRQHFGNRAEKLTEFDLKPLRSRARQPKVSPPEVKPPSATPPTTTTQVAKEAEVPAGGHS